MWLGRSPSLSVSPPPGKVKAAHMHTGWVTGKFQLEGGGASGMCAFCVVSGAFEFWV